MRETDKILSIRLSPRGLSFWIDRGKEAYFDYDRTLPPDENLRCGLAFARKKTGKKITRVHIYIDTLRTVLIPHELFDTEMARDYFGINGITVAANDRLFVSDLDNGGGKIKIITAVDGAWIDIIDEIFEEHPEFLSPFLINLCQKNVKDFTAIYLTPRNIYITVYAAISGRMLFCEALPYSSVTDILYYMTDLAGRFDILKGIVNIKGYRSRETLRTLRKKFKKAEITK